MMPTALNEAFAILEAPRYLGLYGDGLEQALYLSLVRAIQTGSGPARPAIETGS
jgi:hypothetical protein